MVRLTGYGKATKSPLSLQILGLANSGLWRKANRIENETILVSLHLPDHFGLIFRRAVMVNDTKTAEQSHMDSHVMLGDSIHGRRQERGLQGNTLGNGCVESDLRRSET